MVVVVVVGNQTAERKRTGDILDGRVVGECGAREEKSYCILSRDEYVLTHTHTPICWLRDLL